MQFLKSGDIVTVGNRSAAYVVVEYPARLGYSPWTIDPDTVSISVCGIVENVPRVDVHKLNTRGFTLGDKVKVAAYQSFDYDRECVISGVVIDPNDASKSWAKVDFWVNGLYKTTSMKVVVIRSIGHH